MGLVSTKNYVLANAVENMLAPAKKPPPLPPPATAKPDFGKVPAYLHDVKARLAAEKQAELDRQAAEVRAWQRNAGLASSDFPSVSRRLRRRPPRGCACCQRRSACHCCRSCRRSGRR
jgi:hypothetical protein